MYKGGARSVTVIVTGNGPGDQSIFAFHVVLILLGKV